MILRVAPRAVRLLELCSKSVTLAVSAALVSGQWVHLSGKLAQLFLASFEAWVSTSTCFGHPPCLSFDAPFFAVKCSSKKRNRRVSQTLRSCFRARGPLGVFVASRLTPPKPLQSSLRSLFASSSTTLLRSAAMRCRVESAREEGPHGAAFFFLAFSATSRRVLCRLPAVAPTVGRSELAGRAVPAVFPVRTERTAWLHRGSRGQSRLVQTRCARRNHSQPGASLRGPPRLCQPRDWSTQ